MAVVGGELDGVGQQVHEHGADLVGINFERAKVSGQRKMEMELACVDERVDLIDDVPDQAAQFHRATLEGTAKISARAGLACGDQT